MPAMNGLTEAGRAHWTGSSRAGRVVVRLDQRRVALPGGGVLLLPRGPGFSDSWPEEGDEQRRGHRVGADEAHSI